MRKHAFFSSLFVLFLAVSVSPFLQGCWTLAATGVAAGAYILSDRRTTGAYLEDQTIETTASSRIRETAVASKGRVVTVSYNRYVLVLGQVPSEEARQEAIEVIRRIQNVRGVYNELTIGPNSAFSTRISDSNITASVKKRLSGGRNVTSGDIKVVTENGVVYLMGLVTRVEGEDASDVASTTKDVIRVVRLFEYLSEEEAQAVDARQTQQ